MAMTCMLDITRAVLPPRATFVDFPPGHTTGGPFDPDLQEGIVRRALLGLETMTRSGDVQMLPIQWAAGDAWKQDPLPSRLPRIDTPQYQLESDRVAARAHATEPCPVCAL